ncbi:MAG: HAMP domain-containing histidine kinase [Actinomycetota bacterium]|nr:HAMP domain-containing histidine kinase [Actinomycetota bacterium]
MSRGPRLLRGTSNRLATLPLRVRLVSVVVVLLAAALAASGLIVNVLLRTYLLDRSDDELHIYAGIVAGLDYDSINAYPLRPNFTVRLNRLDGSNMVEVVDSSTEASAVPALTALAANDPRVSQSRPYTVASTADHEPNWRVIAGVTDDGKAVYEVAVSLRPMDATLDRVITDGLLIGLAVLAASMVIGWYAVRRSFRPLNRIEDTAAAIAAGDLTQRMPDRPAPVEVASLTRSLNAMLTQIEQSFAVREASEDRMREFVADASHELRTPLATVRGYAELYRQGAVSRPEDVRSAFGRIESEAGRMGSLVEDLLVLARLDEKRPLSRDEVDLAVLAGDARQDAHVLAPDRHVRLVGVSGPLGAVHVVGDEPQLRQVMTNLVSNALNHTPPGTPVEIAVGYTPAGCAVIEVRDHGPGIDPRRARKVFERFYRTDPSRSRAQGGSGLGLAIVAAIVAAHQGSVRVTPTDGGGATFTVELPQALHRQTQADTDVTSVY